MLVFLHEAHIGKDSIESGIGIEVLQGRIGNDIASRAECNKQLGLEITAKEESEPFACAVSLVIVFNEDTGDGLNR